MRASGLNGHTQKKKSLEIRKGQLTGVGHQYSQTGLKVRMKISNRNLQNRAEHHGQELLRGCHNFIRQHESVTGSFFLIYLSPEHRHGCPVTLHQCLLNEHLSGCFPFVGGHCWGFTLVLPSLMRFLSPPCTPGNCTSFRSVLIPQQMFPWIEEVEDGRKDENSPLPQVSISLWRAEK